MEANVEPHGCSVLFAAPAGAGVPCGVPTVPTAAAAAAPCLAAAACFPSLAASARSSVHIGLARAAKSVPRSFLLMASAWDSSGPEQAMRSERVSDGQPHASLGERSCRCSARRTGAPSRFAARSAAACRSAYASARILSQ